MNYIKKSDVIDGIDCFESVSIERNVDIPKPPLIEIIRRRWSDKDLNKEYNFKYKGFRVEIIPWYQLVFKNSSRKRFSASLTSLYYEMERSSDSKIVEHRMVKIFRKPLFRKKEFVCCLVMEKGNYYTLEVEIKKILDKHLLIK